LTKETGHGFWVYFTGNSRLMRKNPRINQVERGASRFCLPEILSPLQVGVTSEGFKPISPLRLDEVWVVLRGRAETKTSDDEPGTAV